MAGPQLVQDASADTGASGTVAFANPAAAGDLLLAYVVTTTSTPVLDSGFVLQAGAQYSTVGLQIWSKTASGGEQTITLSGGAPNSAIYVQEWANAALGSVGAVGGLTASTSISIDTGAPPANGAVAIVAAAMLAEDTGFAVSPAAGWSENGNAPGAGVSSVGAMWLATAAETTLTGTTGNGNWKRYCPLWLASTGAPNGPTIGTLAGDASFTASASSSILGRAALAGDASATQSGSATLTGIAALLASAAFVATTTASLVGFGGLAGTAPLAYSVRAALAGTGPIVATLAGSAPVAYTNVGKLRGLAFAKASASSAYSVQAAPRAMGVLAGTGGFQYAAAPRLLGIAQAVGSADYTYTLALRPPGSATLVGVASAGFSISGRAVGIARSAGTSPSTYSATARGISRAWLSGSAGASESVQARLAAVGRLVGVANAASFTTARLYGTAAIYGDADATFAGAGALINGIVPPSYPPWSRYVVQLAYRSFTVQAPVRTFTVQWSTQMEQFDTLDSRETAVLTFDATPALAAGETLTSATPVGATLLQGQTNAPLPTLTGTIVTTAQINPANATAIAAGCAVQVKVAGGQSGCVYALSTTVQTTNAAKVLELKGALPVQDT